MPVWLTVTTAALVLLITMATAWRTVFRPLMRSFAQFESAMPVLYQIAAQFRTDSGTTLRDVVNRLEVADHSAQVKAEAAKSQAEVDRGRVEQLIITLDRLAVELRQGLALGAASRDRLEVGAAVVARDLAIAQTAVDGVAADLADSHGRADAISSGNPGEAADAASQSPTDP